MCADNDSSYDSFVQPSLASCADEALCLMQLSTFWSAQRTLICRSLKKRRPARRRCSSTYFKFT